MKIKLIIIFLCISLFLCINKSYGLKTPEFIEYLSNKIYEDCKGSDINIKEGFMETVNTKQPFTVLKWPYDISTIKKIIQLFTENGPYLILSRGWAMGSGEVAQQILTCKNHKLDISGDDYYWDGIKVELPKYNVDIDVSAESGGKATLTGDIIELEEGARYTKTEGDFSPATSGDNSPVVQENIFARILTNLYFSISVTFTLGLSIILNFILGERLKRNIIKKT